jgi:GGDEF domain-containing protein
VHGDDDVAHAVELVKTAIAHPFVLDGQRLPVTASIGAALFPRDGLDAAALARAADADMYRAKREARMRLSNGAPVLPDCATDGAAP